MTKLYPLRWLFTLLLLFSAVPLLVAATITVTDTSDDSETPAVGTLRQAVRSASSGDTIIFATSTNGTPIVLDETFITLNKNLTIMGNGMSNTIIDGGGATRIFSVTTNATVRVMGTTIQNGSTTTVGGGIRIRLGSTLMLRNVIVQNCAALGGSTFTNANGTTFQGGGGIANEGTLFMNRVFVAGNTATVGSGSGGGILNAAGASLDLFGCRVSDNTANRAGGGIEDASGAATVLSIRGSVILDNVVNNSPGNGGGIHIGDSCIVSLTLDRINGNEAGSEGGGVWLGAGGQLAVRRTVIDGNTASGDDPDMGGGGLYNDGGMMRINPDTRISNNAATGTSGSGGGILNAAGTLRIADATIRNNTAIRAGGGIEDASGPGTTLQIFNSRIDSNVVTTNPGNGGGIHIGAGGGMSMRNGSVSFNTAGSEGGGLWNDIGRMTIRAVRVANNEASGDDASQGGGGLYNNGGTLVVNPETVVMLNRATGVAGSGGGILNATGGDEENPSFGSLRVNDATISDNVANRAGGGIEDVSGPTTFVMMINARLTGNSVTDVIADTEAGPIATPSNGGGLHVGAAGSSSIIRSTVSGNTAGQEGGGLWNDTGVMYVRGTAIANNTASGADADQGGGGVYNNGGTLTIDEDTEVIGNIADGSSGSGGGIFNAVGGTLALIEASITGNTANRAGGGIEDASGEFSAATSIVRSMIDGNQAVSNPGNGGGIHLGGASNLVIANSSVQNNTASAEGGGLWNGTGTMSLRRVILTGNDAQGNGDVDDIQGGGGIYNDGGLVEVTTNTIITDNTASGISGSGGGILSAGDEAVVSSKEVIVQGSIISSNTANRAGGGVEIALGSYTSTNVNYDANDAGANPGNGGALHVTAVGPTTVININGGSITNNVATQQGGGLWNQTDAFMSVSGVSVTGNSVTSLGTGDGERVAGGGIYNNGGDLNVTSSTIADNSLQTSAEAGSTVATAGGGIANDDGGSLTVEVSTIAGNSAESGGGIANVAIADIQNSTITDNTAAVGGGIAQAIGLTSSTGTAAVLSLQGTILSGNNAPVDSNLSTGGGDVVSAGYNFFGDYADGTLTPDGTDKRSNDAMLGILSDNGGRTRTYMPECGSPVIGMGDPNSNQVDQIGQPIVGVRDIGSFEVQEICSAVVGREQNSSSSVTQADDRQEDLNIYPNPAQGSEINVVLPDRFVGKVTVRIIDASGRVLRTTIRNGSGRFQLPLGDLSGGSYSLQATSQDMVENVRFVINR